MTCFDNNYNLKHLFFLLNITNISIVKYNEFINLFSC